MTNPNNSIGTNGAFGGRTSVNAFNDVMGFLSRGILSGWACVPNSGLTVSLGGNGTTRDSAVAVDNAGNKTSINNISNSPINITIGAAPGTNSRIDAIVAYVDNPPAGNATETDNPDACGLIVVPGTAASTPVAPNDSAIRTAITADGASGTTAYYVVLAYITMANGTTDITSDMIADGDTSVITPDNIADGSIKIQKLDLSTFSWDYSTTEKATGGTWIDGSAIYKKTINFGALPNNAGKTVAHGISNLGRVVKLEGMSYNSSTSTYAPLPYASDSTSAIDVSIVGADIRIYTFTDRTAFSDTYVTLYYTKTS